MEKERIIFTSPHIIQNIFQYLNISDLSRCAQVCSLWHGMVTTEKKRRIDIHWLFQVGACQDPENKARQKKLCDDHITDHSTMQNEVFTEMKNIPIQPTFCMAFMSGRLFENFQDFFPNFDTPKSDRKRFKTCFNFRKRQYLDLVLETSLKSFLPVNCPVTFTVAPGIVGCDENCVPLEIEEGPAMSALFLPEIPGVKVNHFPVSGKNCNLAEHMEQNAPVKALIIFLSPRGSTIANKLLQSCHSAEEIPRMAVGGAIIDHTESLLGSVTTFSGPNVEAASLIVNSHDREEEISAKFETFKGTDLLNHKCFAFMFACVGRGFHYHQDYSVESKIFCTMFPKVPLFGVFGNGEIGVNYLPNASLEDKKLREGKFEKFDTRYLYGYTSIFLLISIKV